MCEILLTLFNLAWNNEFVHIRSFFRYIGTNSLFQAKLNNVNNISHINWPPYLINSPIIPFKPGDLSFLIVLTTFLSQPRLVFDLNANLV